jgi:hypothetical protein
MPEDITLGDFVKQLAVLMESEKLIMLFKDEAPWHLLFYRLKKMDATTKPEFLKTLRFDWDGSYPRCQELSEFIQALHWTGSVVAANPSYDRITLQDQVRELWYEEGRQISPELGAFLSQGVEYAKEQFPHQ